MLKLCGGGIGFSSACGDYLDYLPILVETGAGPTQRLPMHVSTSADILVL
jgi:hypothetical protein